MAYVGSQWQIAWHRARGIPLPPPPRKPPPPPPPRRPPPPPPPPPRRPPPPPPPPKRPPPAPPKSSYVGSPWQIKWHKDRGIPLPPPPKTPYKHPKPPPPPPKKSPPKKAPPPKPSFPSGNTWGASPWGTPSGKNYVNLSSKNKKAPPKNPPKKAPVPPPGFGAVMPIPDHLKNKPSNAHKGVLKPGVKVTYGDLQKAQQGYKQGLPPPKKPAGVGVINPNYKGKVTQPNNTTVKAPKIFKSPPPSNNKPSPPPSPSFRPINNPPPKSSPPPPKSSPAPPPPSLNLYPTEELGGVKPGGDLPYVGEREIGIGENKRIDFTAAEKGFEQWYKSNYNAYMQAATKRMQIPSSAWGRKSKSLVGKWHTDQKALLKELKAPVTGYKGEKINQIGNGFGMWDTKSGKFKLPGRKERISNSFRASLEEMANKLGAGNSSLDGTKFRLKSMINDRSSFTGDAKSNRRSGMERLGTAELGKKQPSLFFQPLKSNTRTKPAWQNRSPSITKVKGPKRV